MFISRTVASKWGVCNPGKGQDDPLEYGKKSIRTFVRISFNLILLNSVLESVHFITHNFIE